MAMINIFVITEATPTCTAEVRDFFASSKTKESLKADAKVHLELLTVDRSYQKTLHSGFRRENL